MANLITASTYLFAMKLCKPITLWCLVLRLFRNLPDEEFHAFEAEVRNLTGMAALAILGLLSFGRKAGKTSSQRGLNGSEVGGHQCPHGNRR